MREKVKTVNFALAKLLKMILVDEIESQNCELCFSKTIENDFWWMREKVKSVNFAIPKLLKMTLVDERESQTCELCFSKTIEHDFGKSFSIVLL